MRRFLLVSLGLCLAVLGIINSGFAAVLTVQPGGILPVYSTIEAALAAANPAGGDIIKVMPGTYNPPAGGYAVNIPVQIVSQQGPDKTIIKTTASSDYGFIINHSNITISGFNIKPPFNTMPDDLVCGILLGGDPDWTPAATPITGVKITKCIVELFSVGINIRNAHGTVITNNTVRYNTLHLGGFFWQGTGILLFINKVFDITNTEISHNLIYDNQYYGVMLDDVSGGVVSFDGTKITSNTFYNNGSNDINLPSNWNSSAIRIDKASGTITITNNKFLTINGANYTSIDSAAGTVIVRSGNHSFSTLKGILTGGSVSIDP